jgi:AcrR family transcriptional regulator
MPDSATGSGVPAETPRRGRPRSKKAREAILGAAVELMLDQGIARMSMDAVAEQASVSKATIYRWWPSKEALALEALLEWAAAGLEEHDTGSLRGDLLATVLPWVGEVKRRRFGRAIAALIAQAQADPHFAETYRTHFVERRRKPARAAFERAIARGDVEERLDIDLALDLVYGPLYHRLLHGHAPLNERFAREVIDHVVVAIERQDAAP